MNDNDNDDDNNNNNDDVIKKYILIFHIIYCMMTDIECNIYICILFFTINVKKEKNT